MRRLDCVCILTFAQYACVCVSYDVDAYYRDVLTTDKKKRRNALPRPKRIAGGYDFQFFYSSRLNELHNKEMTRWARSLETDDMEKWPPGV